MPPSQAHVISWCLPHLRRADKQLVPFARLPNVEQRAGVMVSLDAGPVPSVLAHGQAGSHAEALDRRRILAARHVSGWAREVARRCDGLEVAAGIEHPEDADSGADVPTGQDLRRDAEVERSGRGWSYTTCSPGLSTTTSSRPPSSCTSETVYPCARPAEPRLYFQAPPTCTSETCRWHVSKVHQSLFGSMIMPTSEAAPSPLSPVIRSDPRIQSTPLPDIATPEQIRVGLT